MKRRDETDFCVEKNPVFMLDLGERKKKKKKKGFAPIYFSFLVFFFFFWLVNFCLLFSSWETFCFFFWILMGCKLYCRNVAARTTKIERQELRQLCRWITAKMSDA